MCFRCCQKNSVSTTETVAALNRHNDSECARDKVLKVMTIMTTKCYVCSLTACDGIGCITDHRNHCFKCLGFTGRMNSAGFHLNKFCPKENLMVSTNSTYTNAKKVLCEDSSVREYLQTLANTREILAQYLIPMLKLSVLLPLISKTRPSPAARFNKQKMRQ